MIRILVDADACPVKEEIYKVAFRHAVPVTIVSNSPIRIPADGLISRAIVPAGPDVADDWIAERADASTVCITADILLAERCIKVGAIVIAPNGKFFTEDSIGGAVAMRALMADLRSTGDICGGPPPFTKSDRSRFLSALQTALVRLHRTAQIKRD
ncbi:YaiI/YqxD family protein [Xanthobacter sp. TB0139]|uniref:YaiI/YqxD family protein n=1 Tax=Xanthobacter sp. TB0139 TaxID=3459178 RepID=UPI00403A780B